MKTKTTFLKVTSGLALALLIQSCSMVKTGDFTQQKYTRFHKGEMAITTKSVVHEKEVLPVELASVKSESAKAIETISQELTKQVNNPTEIPAAVSNFKESKSLKTNPVISKFVNRSVVKFAKRLENTFASHGSMVSYSDDQLLLIILAILLPPLAVYLAKGIGTDFWIDLILSLFFWVPGIIYAIIVIMK